MNDLLKVDVYSMPPEHREVWELLKAHTLHDNAFGDARLTQKQIAIKAFGLGRHETHEGHLSTSKYDTTTRKIRSIVESLRKDYKCPILSDRRGYWIEPDVELARPEVERVYRTVKARIKGSVETYRVLEEIYGIKDDLMETQASLF